MRAYIFILLLLFLPGCRTENTERQVCFKDVCLQAAVADSAQKRAEGLMFKGSLPEGRGMLFVFDDESMPCFWMKNVRFALDIIWLKQDKTVADISESVLPCGGDPCPGIMPKARVRYALEVDSGFVAENRIKIGDKAEFRKFVLDKRGKGGKNRKKGG